MLLHNAKTYEALSNQTKPGNDQHSLGLAHSKPHKSAISILETDFSAVAVRTPTTALYLRFALSSVGLHDCQSVIAACTAVPNGGQHPVHRRSAYSLELDCFQQVAAPFNFRSILQYPPGKSVSNQADVLKFDQQSGHRLGCIGQTESCASGRPAGSANEEGSDTAVCRTRSRNGPAGPGTFPRTPGRQPTAPTSLRGSSRQAAYQHPGTQPPAGRHTTAAAAGVRARLRRGGGAAWRRAACSAAIRRPRQDTGRHSELWPAGGHPAAQRAAEDSHFPPRAAGGAAVRRPRRCSGADACGGAAICRRRRCRCVNTCTANGRLKWSFTPCLHCASLTCWNSHML